MNNISYRLRARILVAALLVTGLGILALLWQFNLAKEAHSRAEEARYASYHLADELRQSSDDLTRLGRTYVVSGDPRWEKQYLEVLDIRNGKLPRPLEYHRIYWDFRAASDAPVRAAGQAVALLDLMKEAGMSEAELAKLAEAKANSDDLVRTETIAMNMVKGLYDDGQGGFTRQDTPDLERARLMMHDASYHANKAKIMKPVDEFFVLLDQRTLGVIEATDVVAQRWQQALIGYAVVMVALCVVLTYLSLSDVARGLGRATAVVQRVAEGQLDQRIEAHGRNEIDAMMRGLQQMIQGLAAAIQQVRGAANSITTASSEIATGNQDLSARTEQTASNLQQTASSMEELTATVRQSADAARQANQLAASAAQIAARGGAVVGQVVTTMDEINHSSKKINDIIGVIDGIAFQTNILALNAAVEAARAGEQGRGFAVVAGEVRNLAQRSAEAAKEIKGLIGTSVGKVAEGSRLVADAGQTMNEIVGSVQRVSDIIGEITAAASEQSEGIGQVNTSVNQLDQMTQQNAALVEQSAAAAESLKEQAKRLSQVVMVFRIDGMAASPAPVGTALAPTPGAALPAPAPALKPKSSPQVPKTVSAPASAPRLAAPAVAAPLPAAKSVPVAKPAVSAGQEGDWESF